MQTKKKYIVHLFNGHADEVIKFVEVEGKKFIDDGTGKAKLDDKQQPIPYVENKGGDNKDIDLEKLDLEILAEKNPHVKKMLEDQRVRAENDKKLEDDKKAKEEADAIKNGEFQKVIENNNKKITDLSAESENQKKMLSNYKTTIVSILTTVKASIPKDKLSLIPDKFSEREQLEYIVKNAEILGAKSIFGKGGDIPPSDKPPIGTDLDKAIERFGELQKKGGAKTPTESNEMWELAGKIKTLQAEKNNAK